ncbi:TetR/AcrR family transcriptional regulator [Aquirhabdus sp.]|uniref:TetR/AcrR family transcriptional regulator n=1 Tax=Aquirhabdus sp. TaxID=2824160 RepID=UPI00396C9201
MQKLSGTYDSDAAGLPRGRTSLSSEETKEAQYRRLLRASISAFAELGYAATTINDIVSRARVSRQAFYKLFETKEDCFLAAEQMGRAALFSGIIASMDREHNTTNDLWIRAPIRTYLRICSEEPEFTKAWIIEFPNASARTLARRNAFFIELAAFLREAHRLAKAKQPESWLLVPDTLYEAVVGGAHEMIFRCVSQSRFGDITALEDTIITFTLNALGYRPDSESSVIK